MFVRSVAAEALDRKKELFSLYDQDRREEQRRMKGWLEELKAGLRRFPERPARRHRRRLARRTAHGGVRPRGWHAHPAGRGLAEP